MATVQPGPLVMSTTSMQAVVMGPRMDLHPGLHEGLIDDPPPQVRYRTSEARHHFALVELREREPELLPFERFHFGEFVEFGPGTQVVHTSRWPVIGRRAWITDLDDFGSTFTLGRHGLGSDPHEPVPTESDDRSERQSARARMMLAGFAHPSCKAVLFWSHFALEEARGWLSRLGLESEGHALLAKSHVLYPAQRALCPALVRRKWQQLRDLHVVFVGRDYEIEHGRWALQAFRILRGAFPDTRFTYVGPVPDSERELTQGVEYWGELPRNAVLKLFEEAHVLFHPARQNSCCMLLAAAAHGLAVVAACNPGVPQLEELLPEGHAEPVNRDPLRPQDEPYAFDAALRSLLLEPERARAMALAAYQRASEGELALEARNRRLHEIYLRARAHPAETGLVWQDLPHAGALQQLSIEGETLSRAAETYRRRHAIGMHHS